MTADRHLIAEIAGERIRGTYGECVYCGRPCIGLACRTHRDLLQGDPNYYDLRLRRSPNTKGTA